MAAPFRVAIIGGGYAGYALARYLDPHLDVTLIEAREAFVHNVGAIRAMAEPGIIPQLLYPYGRLLRHGRVVRGGAGPRRWMAVASPCAMASISQLMPS